jgi:3-oxoacyl-[acyl-carrier protein] reductase
MNEPEPQSLSRVVVVTGGGTGIGLGVATAFVRHGDRVILVGRRAEILQRAATCLGTGAQWRKADISSLEDVRALADWLQHTFGAVHVLVNCAGGGPGIRPEATLSEAYAVWQSVTATNLTGAFLMAQALSPLLPDTMGRIVFISSIAAFTGGTLPGGAAYAASKAGLHGLTAAFARGLGPRRVTVNSVAPGFVGGTEITQAWSPELLSEMGARSLLGRVATPEEIAETVLFLASPGARYITGKVIPVDGGLLPTG